MGLSRVWLQTLGDGLVRADQITGIDAHQTPALTGKPARWLLDVVLAVPIGSGHRDGWTVTALHRTVIQTGNDPSPAAPALARLLAQLDVINAAGIISASLVTDRGARQAVLVSAVPRLFPGLGSLRLRAGRPRGHSHPPPLCDLPGQRFPVRRS